METEWIVAARVDEDFQGERGFYGSFQSEGAATKAARKAANETVQPVAIYFEDPFVRYYKPLDNLVKIVYPDNMTR